MKYSRRRFLALLGLAPAAPLLAKVALEPERERFFSEEWDMFYECVGPPDPAGLRFASLTWSDNECVLNGAVPYIQTKPSATHWLNHSRHDLDALPYYRSHRRRT
jgi:hypothetical protein